eukprot:scaffold321994_cov47-Attheya_sp.AAC.1
MSQCRIGNEPYWTNETDLLYSPNSYRRILNEYMRGKHENWQHEAIFWENIVTGHTLAGCNKIPSSTKGLCDLTDLDLAITIAMGTCA